MRTFGFIRRLLKDQPFRFLLSVGLLTLAGVTEGLGVAALVPLLTILSGQGSTGGRLETALTALLGSVGLTLNLATALAFVALMVVGSQAILLAQARVTAGSILKYTADLEVGLYRDTFAADWPFFVSQRASSLINALLVESLRVMTAYTNLNTMLAMAILAAVYGIITIAISWQMTLLIAVTGLVLAWSLRRRVAHGSQLGNSLTELNENVQAEAIESIQGAKLVKGCAAEEPTVGRFRGLVERSFHQNFLVQMNGAWIGAIYSSVSVVVVLAGIYIAVEFFKIPYQALFVFLFAFFRIAPRLNNIQQMQHSVLVYLPALDKIDELKRQARAAHETTGTVEVDDLRQGIHFRNLSFAYAEKPVLDAVTLEIAAGQTTAVVGPSGAGKTTIIDLVMRLILPTSGSLDVDGVDIRDVETDSWRRRIAYVAQDAVLFHTSVRENIAWGSDGLSEEELKEAAKLAYADDFIAEMPDGWDTVVGDRGMRLSGGQRQRIALARAIARKPSILILDEATSALDAESETKIQQAVAHLAKRMTILVVTHRLATVRDADVIYVLEGGRVIEQGSYAELVARGGRFDELRRLQELGSGSGEEGDRAAEMAPNPTNAGIESTGEGTASNA